MSSPLPARYETNRNDLRAATAHKQLNSRKRFTRVAGIEDRGPRWMRRWVKRFRRAMFHAMLVSIALSLARRNGLMAVNVNNFYPQLQRPLVRFLNVGEQFVDTGEEIYDAIMHEPENASRRRSPPLLPYASTLPPPEFMHIKERGSPLLSGLGERASAAARYVKSIIGDSGTNHGFIEDNAESYSKQGILSNYYREVVGPKEELNLKKYVTEYIWEPRKGYGGIPDPNAGQKYEMTPNNHDVYAQYRMDHRPYCPPPPPDTPPAIKPFATPTE